MSDFNTQRDSIVINAATTGTITAGVDYVAPASLSNAFIRIVGVFSQGIGDSLSDFNGNPDRNMHVISNPENLLTSITFERALASTTSVEIFWEIIEYVGAPGGANEIIVRHQEALSHDATSASYDTSAVTGVVTDADIAVFATGGSNTGNSRFYSGSGKFTWEYIGGSNVARMTRGFSTSANTGVQSVAVVEFTGSNWTVQRSDHSFVAAATDETETITSVGNISRAFTHYQTRYGQRDIGPQGSSVRAYLSNDTTLTFRVESLPSTASCVAWVISNSQTGTGEMSVERIAGSRADNAGGGTDPDTWTEAHASGAASIADISIMGETASTSAGNDVHLGYIGFEVADLTTINLKRGRDEANRDYRFEVVSWPEVASSATVDDVNTNEITVDAETGVTFTTSSFGSEINSFKIVSGTAESSGTNISSTGGAGTVDLPDVASYTVDTVGAPFTTANNAIVYELSDGTDTAQLAGTHNPKTGWAVVEVLNATQVQGSVFENFIGPILDESEVYYPTANNTTVAADGILTTDATSNIDMQFWDTSDDTWKPFTVTIQAASTGDGIVEQIKSSIVTSIVSSIEG